MHGPLNVIYIYTFTVSFSQHNEMKYIKIISGVTKSLNFYVIFLVRTSLTNVAAGRGLEARDLVLAGGYQDSTPQ